MTIEEKYNQYCKSEINPEEEEWYEFYSSLLETIIDENQDILKNLKEIWEKGIDTLTKR